MAVQVWKVASVVAAYWTTSISMVFANKYLVGERHTDDISLFVSWFQCLMTVMLVAGFKAMRGWRSDNWLTVEQLRTIMFSRPVLAMSGFFVGMLSFNNMCLKLVGVSFYQVNVNCHVYKIVSSVWCEGVDMEMCTLIDNIDMPSDFCCNALLVVGCHSQCYG